MATVIQMPEAYIYGDPGTPDPDPGYTPGDLTEAQLLSYAPTPKLGPALIWIATGAALLYFFTRD